MSAPDRPRLGVLHCALLGAELRKALRSMGRDDVQLSAIPTTCYECRADRGDAARAIEHLLPKVDAAIALCMNCIRSAGPADGCPDLFAGLTGERVRVLRVRTQGELFIGAEATERLLSDGAFLVLPGWLAIWEKIVKETWGFDQGTAHLFFGETVSRLVFLDTGVGGPWEERLAAMSRFTGAPTEVRHVGTSVLEILLEREFERLAAGRLEASSREQLRRARVAGADHAALVDFVTSIGETFDEEGIVQRSLDLVRTLFDPVATEIAPVAPSGPRPDSTGPPRSTVVVTGEASFDVTLRHGHMVFSTLHVRDVSQPETLDRYLPLAATMGDAIALALHAAWLHRRERELVSSLEEKVQALDAFVRMASHDLREPLRRVSGFAELLEEELGAGLGETATMYLGFILSGAHDMQQLIEALLSLSRAGRRALNLAPVNLDRCLDTALRALSVAIEETGAVIARDPLPTVVGDEALLAEVYQNLIANALKFRGDRPPRIHITCAEVGGRTVFGVKDTGIGMPAKDLESVFDAFRRLHGVGDYEGSGIGLSVCRTVIQRHGGRIWVESTPGVGSHFQFTLDETPRHRTA